MKTLSINVNDECEVTLTEYGAEVYNAKHAEFWAEHPQYRATPVTAALPVSET